MISPFSCLNFVSLKQKLSSIIGEMYVGRALCQSNLLYYGSNLGILCTTQDKSFSHCEADSVKIPSAS